MNTHTHTHTQVLVAVVGVSLIHHVSQLLVHQGVPHLCHRPFQLRCSDIVVVEELILAHDDLLIIELKEDGLGELEEVGEAIMCRLAIGSLVLKKKKKKKRQRA